MKVQQNRDIHIFLSIKYQMHQNIKLPVSEILDAQKKFESKYISP